MKQASNSQGPKPRLLVIPHVYAEDICVREIELAKRLGDTFDLYCLCWTDALHADADSPLLRRWVRFRAGLGAVFAPRRARPGPGGITLVQGPTLQAVLLYRLLGVTRAEAWTQWFNRHTLKRVVQDYEISHILLASAAFDLPRIAGVRGFLDIVDWISKDTLPAKDDAAARALFQRSAAAAHSVFAVSAPLVEKLKTECAISAVTLPNGADIKALRSVAPNRVELLRRRWGLENKYVIGYIGNHGTYTGVDFAVQAFEAVRQHIPNAALLIVGPAEHWRPLLEAKRDQGVVWTGPVDPSQIAEYFNALDLGILTQEKSQFTELAFQIKVVEYSACRKFVVSTPLQTWKRLAWPNVLLAELNVDAWVEAVTRAHKSRWQPEWDANVAAFDWQTLAQRMSSVMLAEPAQEALECAS